MTNAKSRLVRIIALALAVLMIVPMALVGCGKTDVDQAAIDAAIKEALDAAQKAQDAADKAAQDAKDAQDKLAEAEKEADKLQAEIDAMKNTTAAPEVTTQAPTQDSTVVDAYIASILLDKESEYNKLVATYKAVIDIYTEADAAAVKAAIATAEIAIGRAATVDYANQLVAGLKAQLEAIPTFSERVKEAYDAIDFKSDVDVIDVVYAYALLQKAQVVKSLSSADEEIKAIFDAEKAALVEFGADELKLEDAIKAEFDRYTGALKIVDEDEVLYADVVAAVAAANIAKQIADVFGGEVGKELDVTKIVFSADLAKTIANINKAYNPIYSAYNKAGVAEHKEAFDIAFVGADYILYAEGDYLKAKLAEAGTRAEQLVAANKEYNEQAGSSKNGIKAIVDAYAKEGFLFDKNITNIETKAEFLAKWMETYGFASDDANLIAIMGAGVYAKFAEIVALKDVYVEWNAKLAAVDASDIEDAYDLVKAGKLFDYAEQGAAVKALSVWYNGTFDKNGVSNKDGVKDAATEDGVKLSAANIEKMIDKHIDDVTSANFAALFADLEKFEKKDGYLDIIKGIEEDAKELNVAELTISEYLAAVADIKADIAALCTTLALEEDDEADYGYAADSVNYGLIPFAIIDTLDAEVAKLVGNIFTEAAKIVEAYIGWKGVAVEDEEGLKFNGKFYDVEKFVINVYSYKDVAALETIYKAISVYDFDGSFIVEDVEGEEVAYTTANVVSYFEQIRQEFYNGVMSKLNTAIKDQTEVGAITTYLNTLDAGNDWMGYGAAEDEVLTALETTYGDKGPKFVYPTKSAEKGTKSNEINVYKSTALSLTDSMGKVVPVSSSDATPKATYSYVDAIKAVAKDADKYATYETKDGVKKLASFDVAGFKAAVDAKIAEYRALWYVEYLKLESTKTDIETIYKNIITTAIKYELWTIEGAFEMYDDAYTFVVNNDLTVTVLDADKEVVAKVKDAEGVEYAITAAFVDGALVIKANDKLLSDVDDAEKTEYVYALADGVSAIDEANAKIGSVPQLLNNSTYRQYKTSKFSTLFEAYSLNEFYLGYASLLKKADAAVTAQKAIANSSGDKMIGDLYTIFGLSWNNLTPTTTTLEAVDAAVTAFINQIEKIAAENK